MERYLDPRGLSVYDKEIKEYLQKAISEVIVQEDSYLKFPTIGKEKTLYIDTTTNKSYRWDDLNLKYYVIGSNYEDISVITADF